MKQEYKFLIDLCNDIKAERDEDGEFNFRWWTSVCDGYETPKSEFVETIINLLIKKDKNFPKREFLKQVHCRIRSGYIYDTLYEKQCDKENVKIKREEKREQKKAEKERQKFIEEYGEEKYDFYYGDVL